MRRLIVGLVALAAAGSARAEVPDGPSAPSLPVVEAAAEPGASGRAAILSPGPLEAALLDRLARLRAKASGADDIAWLERLAAVYGVRQGKPLWIDAEGFSPRALTTMEEIRKADDWGLSAEAFSLPGVAEGAADESHETRAAAELRLSRAALKYIEHARGGRLDPSTLSKWLDQSPKPVDPHAMLVGLTLADDPAAYLRAMHPQHPQFEALRQAYLKLRTAPRKEPEAQPVRIPAGPRIKPGDRHEDIVLVRRRLSVPAETASADLYDEKLETAVRAYLKAQGARVVSVITREVRAALNKSLRTLAPGTADTRRLIVNMERWRWMPDDLGELYVWNNLPEFETRLVKGGRTIHRERIIIGKPDTQTPVFSDRMRFVVFHPEWGVPPSIKVTSLLAPLQYGDYGVLDRRGMRISVNGKTVDPDRYDWGKVDIRRVPIVQDPGPDNPLGQMKFMFPNKHDVYMHDTPAKHLFGSSARMFSAGCIRVRNPRRLAELVFAETAGWAPAEVAAQIAASSRPNSRVDLGRPIPVHNTYFTLLADEAGGLASFADVYGHDRRIAAVLIDGKPASAIREQDPALRLEREIQEIMSANFQARPRTGAPKPAVRVAGRRMLAPPFFFIGAPFRN
jgi:murein L,D-transpeptidase YcbB/YkuD